MKDDQLDKRLKEFSKNIFKYLDVQFAGIDKRFNTMDDKFNKLQSAVDGMAKRFDDEEVERHALSAKADRHGGWIKKLATKTETQLDTA